jgi:uncharacterized protein (TIGR03437 family)
LAATSRSWTTSDFNGVNAPQTLDHTGVTIGGEKAFVSYVSPAQVNVQVPSNVGAGAQAVIVTSATGSSAPVSVTVNVVQPGLLAPPSFKLGATQYAVAFFPDATTYVLPPASIAGLTSRRAKRGDIIVLYGIGFGSVTPNLPAGQLVQQNNTLAGSFHLFIGGTEAILAYDGLAPALVGVYQFNVTVPDVPPGDAVPVTFTLAGAAGTQKLAIAIQ